jgi:hypothetical protein
VSYTEFMDLHTSAASAMRAYFDEAEKTSIMLAKCTAAPLPFMQRLALMSQEIMENSAQTDYLGIKRRLHQAARLGYQDSDS